MENNQQLLEKLSLKEASLESEVQKACYNDNTEKVLILLNSKAREIDVKQMDRNGSLIHAIAKENVKIVEKLLKVGCDPNAKTQIKGLALFDAFWNRNIQIINLLLYYGANIGDALILAILRKNADIVKNILEFGINLNKVEDALGQSVLRIAIEGSNMPIVKLLLEHDADPNHIDKIGNYPLHCTVNSEIVKELLKHGADVDSENRFQRTPLRCALNCKQFETAKIFLEHGANINHCTNDGHTALHEASITGKLKTIEFLLKHGANPNLKDIDSITGFHYAVIGGNFQIVRLYLEYATNLDLCIRDGDGNTIIEDALNEKDFPIMKMMAFHQNSL